MSAGAREMAADFVEGLCRPSAVAVVIALVTCGLILGVALPRIPSSGLSFLLATDRSDHYLTDTGRLRDFEPPEHPTVVLLGASGLRQALPGERALGRVFASEAVPAPRVLNLSVPGARSWDLLALGDRLPANLTAVVVFAVTPTTISYPQAALREAIEEPRFGFTSTALDDEAAAAGVAVPPRVGLEFIDNRRFYAARAEALLQHLIELPFGRAPKPRSGLDDLRRQFLEGYRNDVRVNYRERSGPSLNALGRVIEKLHRQSRIAVIVVESPISMTIVRDGIGEELYRHHLRQIEAFAQDNDAPFLDLNDVLRDADMADYVHVSNRDARKRCATALAAVVRPRLAELVSASRASRRERS